MSLPSLRGTLAALMGGALHDPAVAGTTVAGDLVAEVLGWDLESQALGEGRWGGVGKRSMLARKSFLDTLVREDGGGLGVEAEVVVVGGVRLLNLGEDAWAGGCCEVDGCWVGVCLSLCTLRGRLTDTLVEDTGDVCMVVGWRVIERTIGLLKARFRCLRLIGGSLYYTPKKVCQIIVTCCMLHNLALRRQVPFLQEDGPDGGLVAAVEPVDSEEEEGKEEDIDNRNNIIRQ
ncbi:hypothetical protein NDU88_005765 [Pleurodeles waltl]|uniref:DDE Tnp4 domain-containing protein n=1 Tax=Pleurodeles waltl TaxID=8319 RepID=A0AAV7PNM8_PLEWA|nr:hypothetical protein NDU88_005765 [Pleurodeles waltl]